MALLPQCKAVSQRKKGAFNLPRLHRIHSSHSRLNKWTAGKASANMCTRLQIRRETSNQSSRPVHIGKGSQTGNIRGILCFMIENWLPLKSVFIPSTLIWLQPGTGCLLVPCNIAAWAAPLQARGHMASRSQRTVLRELCYTSSHTVTFGNLIMCSHG